MPNTLILSVCSGNICRSPLAEALLRADLGAIEGLTFASAGVVAGDGDLATDQTIALGLELGVDLFGHRARFLTERVVADADVVFAMSRSHRRAIVEMVPRKVSVTFTMREFARLANSISDEEITMATRGRETDHERIKAAVALVAMRRGQIGPAVSPSEDDIVDPYLKDDSVYQLAGSQIRSAEAQIVRVLSTATLV